MNGFMDMDESGTLPVILYTLLSAYLSLPSSLKNLRTVATLLTGVHCYSSPGDLFLWLWQWGVKLWTTPWVAHIGAYD